MIFRRNTGALRPSNLTWNRSRRISWKISPISSRKPRNNPALQLPFLRSKSDPLKKYIVNVLVDNSDHQGAPVVIERNPTYSNLFGKIEQEAHFGRSDH